MKYVEYKGEALARNSYAYQLYDLMRNTKGDAAKEYEKKLRAHLKAVNKAKQDLEA